MLYLVDVRHHARDQLPSDRHERVFAVVREAVARCIVRRRGILAFAFSAVVPFRIPQKQVGFMSDDNGAVFCSVCSFRDLSYDRHVFLRVCSLSGVRYDVG